MKVGEEEGDEEENFAPSNRLATHVLMMKGGQWFRKVRTRYPPAQPVIAIPIPTAA